MGAAPDTRLFDQVPYGQSIQAAEIIDTFSFLDNWEDRYRYILDLGKALPELPNELRTQDSIVHGCQSRVWLVAETAADSGALRFAADSDALIVRGLIAIVLAALNNKSPAEVAEYDMEGYFEGLALLSHLSQVRGNGLRALLARIRQTAAALS